MLFAALTSPALAGTPVDLRGDALGHGGIITLGDLFDGADGAAAARVVGHAPIGQQAVLDAGEVQLAAHAAGLDWANASGQRRIIVNVVDGTAEPSRGRQHRRARAAQVLVYARSLQAGETIAASDLQWSAEAVAGPGAPHDPDAVVGLAARVPLREGAAVGPHDLVAAKVIRRDQMVAVDYTADGISLSLAGKAMGDAALGDPIQVMNLASKKVIDAVASGPGHAAVGPGADAARAPSAFRTAALP